jgi:hypothetical protein
MSFDLDFEADLAQRRVKRLEHRRWRAQTALASARAYYGSLRELPCASAVQLHHALQQVERALCQLADLQLALDLAQILAEGRGEKHGPRQSDSIPLW